MKLGHEPHAASADASAETRELSRWYDSQPVVRRLWGIKSTQSLRVVVALEPTLDNDDIYPVWLANTSDWARELRARIGCPVELELFLGTPFDVVQIEGESTLIADLFWRDATL